MGKRLFGVFLAGLITLSCLPSPALGAETAVFSDVPVGCWYEAAAQLCAGKGIMVGTGEGRFSPDKVLSRAECGVLALRLHSLTHGGDGTLERAPEDWGRMTLTLADGTRLTSFGREEAPLPGTEGGVFAFDWWTWGSFGRVTADNLQVTLRPDPALSREDAAYPAAQEAVRLWGTAHEGAATLTVGERTVPGTVNSWMPVGDWVLAFHPDEDSAQVREVLRAALDAPERGCWWRDADHYRLQHELGISFVDPQAPATRDYLAKCLALAVGELPALRRVEGLPDVDRETDPEVYMLYEAGVLTGIDGAGTFAGGSSLTRAEAATMAARVLEPELRISAEICIK